MKKKLTFTASIEIEYDDEEFCPETFAQAQDCDYDNIDRPINHLEGLGWTIQNKRIENCQ